MSSSTVLSNAPIMAAALDLMEKAGAQGCCESLKLKCMLWGQDEVDLLNRVTEMCWVFFSLSLKSD